jgi:serine/threonine-protein kinase
VLEQPIGGSGRSRVYLARAAGWHDATFLVAAKLACRDGRSATFSATALRREQRIAREVRHRNVITVFDYGNIGSEPALILDLAHFGSGARVLDRMGQDGRRLSVAAALFIVIEVLRGLEAIHRSGYVHMDLTVSNVLLTGRGAVKVADFGAVEPLSAVRDYTERLGAVLGTPDCILQRYRLGLFKGKPGFVPPEQAAGAFADQRSDLFAAGATLLSLLVGSPPFYAPTWDETLRRAASGDWRRQSERREPLLAEVGRVLDSALAPDPHDRFSSAAEFREAVEHAARRHGVGPMESTALCSELEGLQIVPPRSGIFPTV